jgi:hypothetical protein
MSLNLQSVGNPVNLKALVERFPLMSHEEMAGIFTLMKSTQGHIGRGAEIYRLAEKAFRVSPQLPAR